MRQVIGCRVAVVLDMDSYEQWMEMLAGKLGDLEQKGVKPDRRKLISEIRLNTRQITMADDVDNDVELL
jgi:hypothetical protein